MTELAFAFVIELLLVIPAGPKTAREFTPLVVVRFVAAALVEGVMVVVVDRVVLLSVTGGFDATFGDGIDADETVGVRVPAVPAPAANCPTAAVLAAVVGVATTGAAAAVLMVVAEVVAADVVAAAVIGAAVTDDVIAPVVATGAARTTPPPSPAPLTMIGCGPELVDEFTVICGFGTRSAGSSTRPVGCETLPLGLTPEPST